MINWLIAVRALIRMGIDYGETKYIVYVQPSIGVKYEFDSASDTATPITQWFDSI
jgi:hypothetical protein